MGAIVRNVVKMQGLHCKKIDATHLVSLKMIVSGVKTNKIIPIITNSPNWSQIVPDDHKLSLVITNYAGWSQIVPGDHKFYRMITDCPRWSQIIPDDHKEFLDKPDDELAEPVLALSKEEADEVAEETCLT